MAANPALDLVQKAVDEDHIALLIARNRCGPNLPIVELLHQNAIPMAQFDQCLKSQSFTTKIKQCVKELTENGFGVEAKAALLHESGLPIVYDILRDVDAPAMARLKAHEMLGDVAGKSKKAAAASLTSRATGYQLVINIGAQTIDEFKGVVVDQAATSVFDVHEEPPAPAHARAPLPAPTPEPPSLFPAEIL